MRTAARSSRPDIRVRQRMPAENKCFTQSHRRVRTIILLSFFPLCCCSDEMRSKKYSHQLTGLGLPPMDIQRTQCPRRFATSERSKVIFSQTSRQTHASRGLVERSQAHTYGIVLMHVASELFSWRMEMGHLALSKSPVCIYNQWWTSFHFTLLDFLS